MSISPMRRVYYFTPPDYAVENLCKRRLKVSRFSQCNDAFELAAFNMRSKSLRKQFKEWKADIDRKHGLLCFCRSWKNPVLWAHYAKNHTGVCYGFDVDPKIFVDVRYVSEKLYPDLSVENFYEHVGQDQMTDLFATKFIHWSYEEEVRLLILFSESVPKNELVFQPFSEKMQLKQVIVGPLSTIKISKAEAAVADNTVETFKARLAFESFAVVRQNDRSQW